MLKLTTKQKKWFTVPKDETGETQVEIIHLKPGEVADIEAKANQIVGKQSGDEFVLETSFGLNARKKMYVTAAIVDWKGFYGANDRELKCTDANKLQVLEEFGDWFGDFIEECRIELAEEVAAEQEGAEKN